MLWDIAGIDDVEYYKDQLANIFKKEPKLRDLFLETCASGLFSFISNYRTDYSDIFEDLVSIAEFIDSEDEREEWLKYKKSDLRSLTIETTED
ncbi:hypothetical protein MO867_22205 [Microbulbifer sp. OS29]|uniref:Uncharacterized protein n=1 Tax=Microbulbifer okhotskensis TaxID=2926617 RepID=A0A9X2EW81_9GAMM|nr:hypothetical protein [Microbulbifer okhotskensis]MCO1337041.1 hypothetical protein [Microbulbifer okhotskensis]